jgi:radical SAM superfamily enzyme YgiQ (UPF0313 family)
MDKKNLSLQKNGSRRLNVMFGDFCYINRQTVGLRYVPLSIGMIAQYAKQQFGDDINVSLYKSAEKFLEQAKQTPPDVVGMSVYMWNKSLSQYVAKRIREMFGDDVTIIIGGPSIDSDKEEQQNFLRDHFPMANGIVVNEGEISFSAVIKKILENRKTVFNEPIDGLSHFDGTNLIQGRPNPLTMDLSTMGSPFLSGLMDEFMDGDYQPLIQTSRFCPYTCAFCVSGKNRGKLRGYPIEQVKEELNYVSKKYADRPYMTMYLADENFGIMKRDIEIAEHIAKCKDDFGFPQSVKFYNDKRFTGVSRTILEIMAKQTQMGVALALQTENPLALKASNRRNITDEEINSAIVWAKNLNLPVFTDLIFGLPYETRDSFVKTLNRTIERGFDDLNIINLILMDGVEMNRKDFRKKHNIKTKFRVIGTCYGNFDNNFVVENDEVVISSDTFSYEDYLEIRYLSFMFFTVYNLNFQKWFFHFVRHLGISPSDFFSSFVKPDRSKKWPEKYIHFLDYLKTTAEAELFDTREEMEDAAKKIYEQNGNEVGESTRINYNVGARLNYLEKDWVKSVLLTHLNDLMKGNLSDENKNLASKLIDISFREQINLKKTDNVEPLNIDFDVINWKRNKFKDSLHNFKMPAKEINFTIDKNQSLMIESFQKRFSNYSDQDYYLKSFEFIRPRSFMLHTLKYL